jgi:hypothetical protein
MSAVFVCKSWMRVLGPENFCRRLLEHENNKETQVVTAKIIPSPLIQRERALVDV